MSFLGVQVQQFWTFHILDLLEDTHQFLHIMTIERTEITDVHAVENVLLVGNGTFDSIRQTLDTLSAVIVHHTLSVQPTGSLELDGIIGLVGIQPQQQLFHTTHRTVDTHIVVVENDQQVIGR